MITQEQVDKHKWWHTIDLGNGVVTKGVCGPDHCSEEAATNRFGIPVDLTGKTVLDVGCADGYFSFVSERRGAIVKSLEPNQGGWLDEQAYFTARNALDMKRRNYLDMSLAQYVKDGYDAADIVFYFGVLYHVENPIQELRHLRSVTNEYALIETAIHQGEGWLFRPGWEGDSTNMFYPSISSLQDALKYVGFAQVELIWTDGIRATVKAYVNAPTGDTGGE